MGKVVGSTVIVEEADLKTQKLFGSAEISH